MIESRPDEQHEQARGSLGSAGAYRGKILTPITSAEGGKAGEPQTLYLEDGLLVVDGSGVITTVAPYDPGLFQGPVLDLRRCVLLPGLVDAHTHYPQTRIPGSATGPLLDWLSRSVFPEEARFKDDAYAKIVAGEFIDRMLAVGTTTCVAFSSSSPSATNVLFEALAASGMRAVAGLTLMDQGCPDELRVPCDDAMAACADLIAAWHGYDSGRLAFAMTPRFAPSCSRRLLEAAARLAADRGLYVQTHVSENEREGEHALEAHPYADDYLDVYDKVGLVSRRTLLAHAIHLSPSEWDRIAERRASVVHCPDSNFFLGSGRMRLDQAIARGVPVALGSDVAAGRTFDMRRAIASAYDNALCAGRRAEPSALFAMATIGGAAALGLDASIGSLEPGKEADFIAVRVPEYAKGHGDVLAHVAFSGSSEGTFVERTFVRGLQLARRDRHHV